MKDLLMLFLTFAKIGSFTFGGGYAMLSLIQVEIVNKNRWATDEEILDYYAIGQCTPGIIAINTATFIGYKHKGVWGSIFATLGMVTPSVIIITIIAVSLRNLLQYEVVQHIFGGIRVVVAVLIINAVRDMSKKAIIDKVCIIIAIMSAVLSFVFSISPIYLVITSAIIGLLVKRNKAGEGIQ